MVASVSNITTLRRVIAAATDIGTSFRVSPLSSAVMIAGPTRAKDSSNIEYTLTGMVGARAAFGAAPTSRNM
jgi:hypothetical protein